MKKIILIGACVLAMLASCPNDEAENNLPGVFIQQPNKRGVGYDFTTLSQSSKNSTAWTARDMDLLTGGESAGGGIKWFYSWGISPNAAVIAAAAERGLVFYPMTWNNNYNEDDIRNIVNNSGLKIEYVLAYNEPNFYDQANMTPEAAAAAWPKLKAIAKELNLKIISPAMNFGPMMGPIEWLDAFFAQPNVSINDIDGIAVHIYPWWPSAVKGLLDDYRKYNKPLWLTEFCGWDDLQDDWRTNNWELQAWYMSQAVVYLEMDPMVAKYAWYLPKGHVPENAGPRWGNKNDQVNPYHDLLTSVNADTPPVLTELGKIYVNMTTLDKSVWVQAGQKIDAAQFTNCNLEPCIGIKGWQDIVLSMPTGDSDKSAGILEIRDFSYKAGNNKWVEYQIELPADKNYTLTLRYRSQGNTNIQVLVDGTEVETVTLNSNGAWAETTASLGNIPAGKHVIRLIAASSNADCAINWLVVE